MSKSKGNAVDPMEALQTYGADAIRWYFYTNSAPWLPNRFHGKAVTEGQRKFLSTLWNTYAFYVLYANIDSFDPTKYSLKDAALTIMDKWVLSRLNSTVKAVDENLGNYKIPEAARALQQFVDELSNWYVRRGRERYWVQGLTDDKIAAYLTLYTALVTISKAAAPMIPFMTESIYQNLVRSVDKSAPASIHLCDFPTVCEEAIDLTLETSMDEVLNIVVLGRAARNGANLKNRQPLAKMFVECPKPLSKEFCDIVTDELNIKALEFPTSLDGFVTYIFKPQLKTLGPKYGNQLGEIRAALSNIDGNAAKKSLDENGSITLSLASGDVVLSAEDLLISTEQKPGFFTASDRGVTVTLDTELTPELVDEGFVREIISKLQTMRKEAGFNVMDHINITVEGSKRICDIVNRLPDEIANDTLADSIKVATANGYTKQWDINGEDVTLGVEKV